MGDIAVAGFSLRFARPPRTAVVAVVIVIIVTAVVSTSIDL